MKDIPTSPRIAQIKRNRKVGRLRLIILLIILFISLVGALSYFSANQKILINKVVITGNSIIDSSDLEQSVNEKIVGRYFGLFARANFLIYPHSKIYKSLIKEFPRIESLSVKREGFHTIHITIVERAGKYLYCGVIVPENKDQVGENCYFINNDGYIFDKAPYFSGDIYFKYYVDLSGDNSNPLGLQVFIPSRFHEIARFIDEVEGLGFKPIYLVRSSLGQYSLYLKSAGSNLNPKILFKEENDLNTIFDNFGTAMGEKEFANEINSKYDTLSYIDLRFTNKVLYKFQ
jgi:hypothetical protein